MNRSSPVNVTTASSGRAACLDGQRGEVQADRPALGPADELPHVRFRELDLRVAPAASPPRAESIARSSTPISTMPPWARRRAAGSGNASREPIASCDPAGSPRAMAATVSRHCRLVTASKWSRTSATGRRIAAIADDQPPGNLDDQRPTTRAR